MGVLKLLYDKIGNAIPQYLKRDGSGFEAAKGANGAMDVNFVGSLANAVILQTAAAAAGNGTPYTPTSPMTLNFEISGTSTSRTVIFEIAGPKGVYQVHPALKLGDTTYTPATQTTGGSNAAPETWEVDIPANYSFRARVSAVAGGNVDVLGSAVAQ